MHTARRSLSFVIALLTGIAGTTSLTAQVQALYPFASDLLDATTNYGPAMLTGTPPPAPPNNGVCVNGIYAPSSGGQDVQTPIITSLTTTDFEVDVEFNISVLPATQGPVLIGGNLWRWIGIYLQSNGTVGLKYNNANLTWSSTILNTGIWYAASIRYEAGTVQLFINNALVLQATIGAIVDGNNKNFTTNDYSVAKNFNGCIRNLVIQNDATLSLASATTYGSGCAGSAGVPALAAANTPRLGTSFQLTASHLPPAVPVAFMAIGFSNTTSPLGPLPFNLQLFGLGAGCNLLVSPDVTLLFPAASGSGSYFLSVPADVSLLSFQLYYQCASIDGAAPGGFAVSNGVQASIGY